MAKHPHACEPGHARTIKRSFRLSPRDDALLERDIARSGATSLSAYVRFRLLTGKRDTVLPAWTTLRDWRNEAIKLTTEIARAPSSWARTRAIQAAEEMFKTVSRWRKK